MSIISWFKRKVKLPTIKEIATRLKKWWDGIIDKALTLLYGEKQLRRLAPATIGPDRLPIPPLIVSVGPQVNEDKAARLRDLLLQLSELGKEYDDTRQEETSLREQIASRRMNLRHLEIKDSKFPSSETPVHLRRDIEDERNKIKELDDRLEALLQSRVTIGKKIDKLKKKLKKLEKLEKLEKIKGR